MSCRLTPIVGCSQLLIHCVGTYRPWDRLLCSQPEDALRRDDRGPLKMEKRTVAIVFKIIRN
jgi:hypothetical protein